MHFKALCGIPPDTGSSLKWIRIMQITSFLLLATFLQVSAAGFSQKITLHERNAPLQKVLAEVEQQSGFSFYYQVELLRDAKNVNISVKNASLMDVLEVCLAQQPFTYEIIDKTIVLKPASENNRASSENKGSGSVVVAAIHIHGKVTNAKGEPLEGVTVRLKNGKAAVVTNDLGEFTINVPGTKSVLILSHVGFSPKEVVVGDQTEFNIQLAEQNQSLSEVVIVSYGTQNKKDITGSIAQLNASKLRDMPVGQFAQALQGQMAGVNANINTGRPGQGMEIQVRGAVSINAGNYPLIVLDGQPLSPVGGANPINNINPDEIESFTVLKDASATALYGSRAASGVILITTKQAKKGKPQTEVNAYYGTAALDRTHIPKMMDAHQLATFMNEFFQDKIKYEGYINPVTGTATIPADYANPDQYGKGTDWLGRVTRNAPIQNYSISVMDAREKSSTSVIAGYFNQQGIIKNTGFERYSIRVNNEFRPLSNIKIGFNVAPSYQVDHNSAGSPTDGSRNIVEGALLSSPLIPAFNPDGTPTNQASGFFLLAEPNFEQIALNTNNIFKTARLLGNSYVQVDFLKGLSFKTSAGIDMAGQTHSTFTNQIAAAAFNAPPPRPVSSITGQYATDNYISWVNENTLTYNATFGQVHHLELLGGYTAQKFSEYNNVATGSNYPDASIPYVSAAGTTAGGSGFTQWTMVSMIARANYNYADKYLFSAAVRRDGSSKFGLQNLYGTFPSVSAGWIISNESFMKELRPVSLLKIRASYGLTGNNNFNTTSGNYPSVSLISPITYDFNNSLASGKVVSQLGNSELTWEKNKQTDIGVDIAFFKSRLSITYDYYNKITDGLLYQVNIPQSSGFSSVSSNVGTIKFWGHEITVSSVNTTGDLKWNTSVNISFNRNLIEKLGTQNLPILPVNAYSYPNIQMVGKPVGMFYGYVVDGVYKNQQEFDSQPKDVTSMVGSIRMRDINKDGVITPNDRTIIGNPNPDFLFGITNTFSYHSFDMNIVFAGSYGGQIEDERAQSAANLDGAFNLYANQLDHWRSSTDPGNGMVPSTRAGTTALYRTVNTSWVHDGSYITCKNISLGYTFKLPLNNYINKLRAYVSVQQAFTITKYPGFSPETNSQGTTNLNGLTLGVDNTEYPIPRTVSFGVNVGLF